MNMNTRLNGQSRPLRKTMFTEKDLIRKIRGNSGLNLGNNQKNNFQKDCYCNKNADLHKRDTFFDVARRTNLAETYFGGPKDTTNHFLRHTKRPEEATMMRTYNTVNQNIAALHEIGQRNWSTADISIERTISKGGLKKPQTAAQEFRPVQTVAKRTGSAQGMVRVFSPKDSCYTDSYAKMENDSLRLTYLSMRSAHNMNSVKVCGANSPMNVGKPFETTVNSIKNAKPYTVSAETFGRSWIDRGRPQTTTNYESARFNIINHSYGQNTSISKLLETNPRACHKVKGIAEYCDLARVSAIKSNNEYQEKLRSNPTCFLKAGSLCATQCDFARTYGPFYKLFKK